MSEIESGTRTYTKRHPRGPGGTYPIRRIHQKSGANNYVITVPKSIGAAFDGKPIVFSWSVDEQHGTIMLTPQPLVQDEVTSDGMDPAAARVAEYITNAKREGED